ncbi:MAG: hypothetical protein IRY91_01355 [Gemmatimonadaceae bacterium]|nr:hypothetical protein [Gemmatimonadaceae bacterium]
MRESNDSEMHGAYESPYEVLLGELDALLADWRELVRASTPTELPPGRLMDALPEILPTLIRGAQSGATQLDDKLRDRIAREHGLSRRADAVPVRSVAEEWDAVKRACARVLARRGVVGRGAEEAQRRVDALVDDAIGYTLRGYYQSELDTLRGRGLERRDASNEDRRRGGDRRNHAEGA